MKIFTTPSAISYHQFKVNLKCAKCLEIFGDTNISKFYPTFSFNSPEDSKISEISITGQSDMSKIKKHMVDIANINLIHGKT